MLHRSSIASLVRAFGFAAACFAPSLKRPVCAQLRPEYTDIVELFASGDETTALARLGSWNESRVRANINALRGGGSLLSGSQVRAALLLQALRSGSRPLSQRSQSSWAEGTSCATFPKR